MVLLQRKRATELPLHRTRPFRRAELRLRRGLRAIVRLRGKRRRVGVLRPPRLPAERRLWTTLLGNDRRAFVAVWLHRLRRRAVLERMAQRPAALLRPLRLPREVDWPSGRQLSRAVRSSVPRSEWSDRDFAGYPVGPSADAGNDAQAECRKQQHLPALDGTPAGVGDIASTLRASSCASALRKCMLN